MDEDCPSAKGLICPQDKILVLLGCNIEGRKVGFSPLSPIEVDVDFPAILRRLDAVPIVLPEPVDPAWHRATHRRDR